MDWKEFVTGIILYFLPITLFVVSIFIIPNALWVAISVTWIFTSLLYKIIVMPEPQDRFKRNQF